ncbi:hypothetical protein Patl1_32842 [Pistacia atlantica]|uniref:Uncharacterized protein n=1 Tax=Pistacia atlantica TaxID=434234 RepID=A0ACC1ANF1_9ROSI|nr:hypothetical protein Patl1_32842 [Pistacia atlantica]
MLDSYRKPKTKVETRNFKLNERSVPSDLAVGRSEGLDCSDAGSVGPRRTNRRPITAPRLHQTVAVL